MVAAALLSGGGGGGGMRPAANLPLFPFFGVSCTSHAADAYTCST